MQSIAAALSLAALAAVRRRLAPAPPFASSGWRRPPRAAAAQARRRSGALAHGLSAVGGVRPAHRFQAAKNFSSNCNYRHLILGTEYAVAAKRFCFSPKAILAFNKKRLFRCAHLLHKQRRKIDE
ncbi:hypothetical protein BDR26DRAFT_852806 [Obelidium mucronatum]|nr:hypothetical protein BDR26DRAFT_852806 [Obelidium mucronatum]